jgi:hypothetical protein
LRETHPADRVRGRLTAACSSTDFSGAGAIPVRRRSWWRSVASAAVSARAAAPGGWRRQRRCSWTRSPVRQPVRQCVLSLPFALRYLLDVDRKDALAALRPAQGPLPLGGRCLAVLVPRPRVHLVRYHRVFAPANRLRAAVTPAGRGRDAPPQREAAEGHAPKPVSGPKMQRLKRVFGIEIESCQRCGGALKVIASIEDRVLIERILAPSRTAGRGGPRPVRLARAVGVAAGSLIRSILLGSRVEDPSREGRGSVGEPPYETKSPRP